ncbi:hypothetical protein D3C87_2198890 [compost metagenome]
MAGNRIGADQPDTNALRHQRTDRCSIDRLDHDAGWRRSGFRHDHIETLPGAILRDIGDEIDA